MLRQSVHTHSAEVGDAYGAIGADRPRNDAFMMEVDFFYKGHGHQARHKSHTFRTHEFGSQSKYGQE